METKVSNVTIDTTLTKKSSKKRRKTKRKKMTQPTQEEVVSNKTDEIVPETKDTVPEKRMKRIEEEMRTYVKQGNVDFGNDSSQTYASVNKPHRPMVDNSESSVLHVFARARIAQRHPIPLRILCDTGCNIAYSVKKTVRKTKYRYYIRR